MACQSSCMHTRTFCNAEVCAASVQEDLPPDMAAPFCQRGLCTLKHEKRCRAPSLMSPQLTGPSSVGLWPKGCTALMAS